MGKRIERIQNTRNTKQTKLSFKAKMTDRDQQKSLLMGAAANPRDEVVNQIRAGRPESRPPVMGAKHLGLGKHLFTGMVNLRLGGLTRFMLLASVAVTLVNGANLRRSSESLRRRLPNAHSRDKELVPLKDSSTEKDKEANADAKTDLKHEDLDPYQPNRSYPEWQLPFAKRGDTWETWDYTKFWASLAVLDTGLIEGCIGWIPRNTSECINPNLWIPVMLTMLFITLLASTIVTMNVILCGGGQKWSAAMGSVVAWTVFSTVPALGTGFIFSSICTPDTVLTVGGLIILVVGSPLLLFLLCRLTSLQKILKCGKKHICS